MGNYCLVLLVMLLCSLSNAQSDKPFVKRMTHKQGLSHDASRSVIKDSDGFIWITTENGLNRYDGHHFTVFKNTPADTTSIYGNDVIALCEDAHRNIWISGSNFLSRYNMDNHRFYNYPMNTTQSNAYSGYYVKRFYLDKNKRLWICSVQNGLVLYRTETDDFEYFLPDPNRLNPNSNTITCLAQRDANKYWATSNSGLLQFDFENKTFTSYISEPDKPENFNFFNQCISLYIDPSDDNIIWYGTWGSGLHCYNKMTGKTEIYTYSINLPSNVSNIVFDIVKRNDQSLWLCAERGLISFDKTTHEFHFIQHETDNANSIWGGELQNIYIDNEGLIWLTGHHGVEIIDPLQQLFKPMAIDQKPGLYSLQWNAQTRSLVGTSLYVNRSLWMINPGNGHCQQFHIPEADKKMLEPVGICNLNDGCILIGMTRMNPYIFNPFTSHFDQLQLSNLLGLDVNKLDIRSAIQDPSGDVWMANFKGGIIRWKPNDNTARIFGNPAEEKPEAFKSATHQVMKNGNFIYGFVASAGLICVNANNEECTYLPFNNRILNQSQYVACDSNGHFWFTTPSNGIIECTATDSLRILKTYYHELPDKGIENIYIDSNNCLWINSSTGLIYFNTKTKSTQLYGEMDGLYPYTSDFTLVQGEDDHYYYLTTAGPGSFRQRDLIQPVKYYPTVLSQFLVADKPIHLEAELFDVHAIELQPDQNNISFAFSALCYSGAEKLEFAYKLEGFDSDWHYIGNNHNGSYTNLPPGEYTLLLNSKYKEIPWSTEVTRIEVVVKPHYYQTLWFRLFMVLLGIALIVLVIRTHFKNKLKEARVELEKQKSIQSIRMRISRDIHDEIGAGLTKISLMSKQMEKSMDDELPAKDQIRKINTTSRQLVQNLGEIVWTINPNNDSLVDLLGYLRRYTHEMAESTDIHFSIQLPDISEELQAVSVHPEVKRNLLLIIKESLNNAMKHSEASKIYLNVSYNKFILSATVMDNGKGFVMTESETIGNGLRNMRKRAEDIGTALEIDTNSHSGTRIHIDIML
jgi:signal transduction histidine kinase/ligand-binding sensor domain-containing protein